MLTQLEQAQQRWGGSHSVIDTWLAERQELLVLYYKAAGFAPFERKDNALPEQVTIQSFCQILMDYLSAGHFEIYDNVVAACREKGPQSLQLAQTLYPKIADTTDVALEFNDKYADATELTMVDSFDADLSVLGEVLENRFAMEDELIDNLFSNHSEDS